MFPLHRKLAIAGLNRNPAVFFEAPKLHGGVNRVVPIAVESEDTLAAVAAASEERRALRFAVVAGITSAALWAAVIILLASSLEVPTLL